MLRKNSHRRAMTIIEMMISVALFVAIGVTVVYLVLVSARAGHDATQMIRSEAKARLLVDQIRRETLVGQFLSVEIKDNGRTVEFYDPVKETTADLRYLDGALVFRQDVDGTVTRRIEGIDDVEFALVEQESMLEFEVTAMATDHKRNTRPITIRDKVFLRNVPPPGIGAF